MLGIAASMAVASPATAGQRPTTAASARAVKPVRDASPAKAPPPANQLYGVSCPSAKHCVAVGINENAADAGTGGGALIQTWNGKTWASFAPKAPKGALSATLLGVSCTAVKNCVAVGVGGDGAHGGLTSFAEHWNGTSWSSAGKISWPNGTSHPYLVAVSCRSANSCVAVGFIDADLADRGHTGKAATTSWNGKTWTASTVPAPGKGKGKASLFSEVSCPAAGGCLAVGQLGPYNSDEGSGLAGFWSGTSWKLGTTP